MPPGSQEGDTRPQAVEYLKTIDPDQQLSLRELAALMDEVSAGYDSAVANDLMAVLATRILQAKGLGSTS